MKTSSYFILEHKRSKEDILEIRQDLLDFAREEIIDLIDLEEFEGTEETKKELANDKAFFIALRIFSIHDDRLQGGMNESEIAILLGVTKSRINAIKYRAETKMKHPKLSRDLRSYIRLGADTEIEY